MRASERWGTAVMLVALAGLPAACSKSPSTSTAPGAESPASDDPLTQLDRLEQQMVALGIEVAPSAPAAGEGAPEDMDTEAYDEAEAEVDAVEAPREETDASPPAPQAHAPADNKHERVNRCASICDLNVAICDLEVRICSMSEEHGGDPTYAEACRRASDDCEVSGDACDRCDA